MAQRKIDDLSERSFRFSSDAYDYCFHLARLGGLPARIGYQLFDAATSIGANRAESKSAYSRREFAVKNSICLKEAREAHFWLRMADEKHLGDVERRTYLIGEANELIRIYAACVKRLQLRTAFSGLAVSLLTAYVAIRAVSFALQMLRF
jgi:four helix bundle protein